MENQELVGGMPELIQRAYSYLQDKTRSVAPGTLPPVQMARDAYDLNAAARRATAPGSVVQAMDQPRPEELLRASAPARMTRSRTGKPVFDAPAKADTGAGTDHIAAANPLSDAYRYLVGADKVLTAPMRAGAGFIGATSGSAQDAIANAVASMLGARRPDPAANDAAALDRVQKAIEDLVPAAQATTRGLEHGRNALVTALGWQESNPEAPAASMPASVAAAAARQAAPHPSAPPAIATPNENRQTAFSERPRPPLEQLTAAATSRPTAPNDNLRTAFPARTRSSSPHATALAGMTPAPGPAAMTPEEVAQQKPRIDNADGSQSTERTITIEVDGKHINIPTIVGGKQLSPEDAIAAWRAGKNPAVGTFDSNDEAVAAAQGRSDAIGRAMNIVRPPQQENMADKFRARSAAIDRTPAAGMSEAQRGQALLEAGLAMMQSASRPGGSMLAAVGEGGQRGTALGREFDKQNRDTTLRNRTEAREDLRTEMTLGQHDQDRTAKYADLAERQADRRDRTRLDGQKVDLLRKQVEQGKWKVQDTDGGFVLVGSDGTTKMLTGPDGKQLKAHRKAEDTRPPEVRLLEYLKGDSAAREIYMGAKQRENSMGEKDVVGQAVKLIESSAMSGKPMSVEDAVAQVMQGTNAARAAMGKGAPTPGTPLPKGIPQGSKQIGTAGGKPVYQAPDGKRYTVEPQ